MPDMFEHLAHPLLRQRVRDLASGAEGELMAVVREEVRRVCGDPEYARIAYIRMASGRELPTSVRNIEAV
ncbi:hypothetical protein [Streptomyces sp. NBC_00503]|uniref:hypothetical protein n=1 Tax=Streptomyces sp. NBC_00503 TaxID=2903659 RepID=UPI002E8155E8|nr:hypothetical protein [Streptomyces sp. NBC_00503]WUD81937.1 hypothetical protein OG490_16085 [Streptomyces sp. NBC_00503]